MAKTIDLKPCPFCGKEAWMQRGYVNSEPDLNMWVFCHDSRGCILNDTDIGDLTVFQEQLRDFIDAWNARA